MIGMVITGHGSFPNGMHESVKLISGEIKQLQVIPFENNQDKLEQDLEAAISESDTGEGVVVFADLAGGTPFNVSSRLAATKDNVRVIGGVNSPMLISALFQRELPLDDFVDLVIKEGKENIKPFTINKERNMNVNEDMDGI